MNGPCHPLDPLTVEEVGIAAQAVRSAPDWPGSQARIASIELIEPSSEELGTFSAGDPLDRGVLVVVLDRARGDAYEATVSLATGEVGLVRWLSGLQPALLLDEFVEMEEACKAAPAFREALARRSITDLEAVVIDGEPIGDLVDAKQDAARLAWGTVWLRPTDGDNGYAHPIEGLIPIVDLNTMTVVGIEDHGIVPIPTEAAVLRAGMANGLKALDIVQPEGPSFQVDGWRVSWQGWEFRVGFNWREGLVLHRVRHTGRSILHRASVNEMVVPYGDPSPSQRRKSFFDFGEVGAGLMANALELGCDCLGEIHYFDVVVADNAGEARAIKNAICLHEEDIGVLWKHTDTRGGRAITGRNRRLVVSFFATFANYDYGIFWYFYLDGSIELEVKLTGVLSTMAIAEGATPSHGRVMAPGLAAANHQHFFCARLDVDLDGGANVVYEVDSELDADEQSNPLGNAFVARERLLASELQAQRCTAPLNSRYWRIANPTIENRFGEPVAYRLVPRENVLPFAREDSSLRRRAAFTTRHLWVTPRRPDERFAAGDYPNQSRLDQGLGKWTTADRSLLDEELVVWYTLGSHHVPRPEEWPIMPVATTGFTLKPDGFFDRNPALP